MIADPPLLLGAVNETEMPPAEAVAVTPVGLEGNVAGVTDELAADCEEVPAADVADTLKV